MFKAAQLTLSETDFARLEEMVKAARAWLDADQETKAGRGDYYCEALIHTNELSVFIGVHRDGRP